MHHTGPGTAESGGRGPMHLKVHSESSSLRLISPGYYVKVTEDLPTQAGIRIFVVSSRRQQLIWGEGVCAPGLSRVLRTACFHGYGYTDSNCRCLLPARIPLTGFQHYNNMNATCTQWKPHWIYISSWVRDTQSCRYLPFKEQQLAANHEVKRGDSRCSAVRWQCSGSHARTICFTHLHTYPHVWYMHVHNR